MPVVTPQISKFIGRSIRTSPRLYLNGEERFGIVQISEGDFKRQTSVADGESMPKRQKLGQHIGFDVHQRDVLDGSYDRRLLRHTESPTHAIQTRVACSISIVGQNEIVFD
jgi:hypothetical protein